MRVPKFAGACLVAWGLATLAPSAHAAGDDPIKIGVILPLKGLGSKAGVNNLAAMEMYLDSVGGTVHGRKIQLIAEDDEGGNAALAVERAKKLVEQDDVDILMGGVRSSVCLALAKYVKQVAVPFVVSGNCGAQSLTAKAEFRNAHTVRLTHNAASVSDTAADWAIKAGKRKAIILASDFEAGLEVTDLFSSSFIARGGSIVQEFHPKVGELDLSAYYEQFDPSADLVVMMLAVGGEFNPMLQYRQSTAGKNHAMVLDIYGQATNGPLQFQLGPEGGNNITVAKLYAAGNSSAANSKLIGEWSAKFPANAIPPIEAVTGYTSMQIVAEALGKLGGEIDDPNKFIAQLREGTFETARGTIRLDPWGDVVQDAFLYVIKEGAGPSSQSVVASYPGASQFWSRTAEQLEAFDVGKLKGTWVGKSKDDVIEFVTLP